MSFRQRVVGPAFLLALVSLPGWASDPAATFEAFVKNSHELCATTTPIYFNKTRNQWAKRKFILEDLKYDVKKTDSLVTPILGIVQFRLRVQQSAFVPTKGEAKRAQEFPEKPNIVDTITLRYSFRDDRWSFKDGEFESSALRGQRFPITIDSIRAKPDELENAAVGYWLP